MITITAFSNTRDYFERAFDNAAVNSVTSTQIVATDAVTGLVTTFTGTGLTDPTSSPVGGTITTMSTVDSQNNPVVTFSNLSWNADAFFDALGALLDDGDDGAALEVFLSQDDITADASSASEGVEFSFSGVTSRITLTGSNFEDALEGGDGNDTITPGASDDGESIIGSGGSDLINLSFQSQNAFAAFFYDLLSVPITVAIDAPTDTMTVAKAGLGTDTILDVRQTLQGGGMGVYGTDGNDSFTVDPGANSYLELEGSGGDDTFNITLTDRVRLLYNNSNSTGIVADLSTGQIQDGLGGTDTITVLGGDDRLEIRATDSIDVITGSNRGERFILERGNDTLDGGGGFDELRYDRSGVGAVQVDLAAGIATGTWDGEAFTHVISGIEELEGSRDEGDLLRGSATGDEIDGNGGNDSIYGFDGEDSLEGGAGDDEIFGGNGTDRLDGDEGNDYLDPGNNTDFDDVDAGAGMDTIEAGNVVDGYLNIQNSNLINDTAFTFDINGTANTATIDKGAFGTTTILNLATPMASNNVGLIGGARDDVFNMTAIDGGGVQVTGGRGNDTFNLNAAGDSYIEINFDRDADFNEATQGLVMDLSTGTVSNDGFGFQDSITGIGSVDLGIDTTQFADQIIGSGAQEFFDFNGGNDVIDGGGAFDSISFSFTDMVSGVDANLSTGTAAGVHDAGAFIVTLSNIEGLNGSEFNDVLEGGGEGNFLNGRSGNDILYGDGIDVAATGDISGQVYRIYLATLDREADVGGHRGWTEILFEGTQSLLQVISGFTNSQEFQNTYGALDDTAFVQLLYQNVLGRVASQAEVDGWLAEIANGTAREGVVIGFSESLEFKNNTASASAAFDLARSETAWTDDIYRLYQATLDREADVGGLTGWAQALGDGTAFETIVAGFTNSQEFQNTYGALDDTAFVQLLYQNVLGRVASQEEVDGWLAEIAGGTAREGVVIGFSQSLEFRNSTAQNVEDWVRDQGIHDELQGRSGDNVLMGGILSDLFIFDTTHGGSHTVADLETWDEIEFSNFGYTTDAQVLAQMSQDGADVVFADQGVTVIFKDTELAAITEEQIFF